MLKCHEVMLKVSSDDFVEASWSARTGLRLHLMMCRHCRAYARQLRAIGKLARNAWHQDPSTLERLGQRILSQFESKEPPKQARGRSQESGGRNQEEGDGMA